MLCDQATGRSQSWVSQSPRMPIPPTLALELGVEAASAVAAILDAGVWTATRPLVGAGALGEDVQDQECAIDHAAAHVSLHGLLLLAAASSIDDYPGSASAPREFRVFGLTSAAEIGRGSMVHSFNIRPDDFCARGALHSSSSSTNR